MVEIWFPQVGSIGPRPTSVDDEDCWVRRSTKKRWQWALREKGEKSVHVQSIHEVLVRIAKAVGSLEFVESVGQEIDEFGNFVWHGTTDIISHDEDALLVVDQESESSVGQRDFRSTDVHSGDLQEMAQG
ncbi:hypothetical protein NE237_007255 [Protea cynaroides]|uniref:Uncharacterized protein n=1 Tax=Protea cynaroides TaxID=273540 RepID=A0A9Q0KP37_9MAGN|nr:hypothetical protein NE237_007255 [Protea cynaroides]